MQNLASVAQAAPPARAGPTTRLQALAAQPAFRRCGPMIAAPLLNRARQVLPAGKNVQIPQSGMFSCRHEPPQGHTDLD